MFKRYMALVLAILQAVLLLSGCGGKTQVTEETAEVLPADENQNTAGEQSAGELQDAAGEPAEPDTAVILELPEEETPESMTVMVFMVGSDLEAGGAAASADMAEMAAAGVNTGAVNLLVYTGGSKKWHSDVPNDANAVFLLTGEGFVQQETLEQSSMGDPDSLTYFLRYGYENYPAESYALILWDHGNGPVIGYGLDKLANNDTLTLNELRTALEESPFGQENRLDFIGFDACLMASAELVYSVADYAKYLIASQETEPSCGWDYSFLKDCCLMGPAALSVEVVRSYMAYCRRGFKENAFFNSDITLAVIDLSYAGEMFGGIEALFKKASDDVSGGYVELARARIPTRTLGKASTGTDYDLVDFYDLLEHMEELYPKEAASLIELLGKMVLCRDANTEKCCGLSIYYPFYNKNHYISSWRDAYSGLNCFPSYTEYLKRYSQVWLGTDMKAVFRELADAEETAPGTYTLRLTDEQAEMYAGACFYVLRRTGEGQYSLIYQSGNVSEEDGVITANYSGKTIYVSDRFGYSTILTLTYNGLVGEEEYYSAWAYVSRNSLMDPDYADAMCEIHLAVDNGTGELRVKEILEGKEDDSALSGGKRPVIDLQDWEYLTVYDLTGRYLTRDERGAIADYWDWPVDDWITASQLSVYDDIRFSYEPLYDDGSEYYVLFEVQDVQGNSSRSELLPVTLTEFPEKPDTTRYIDAELRTGGSVLLDESGVKMELVLYRDIQTNVEMPALRVTNSNDFTVTVRTDGYILNGSIYSPEGSNWLNAAPGKTVYSAMDDVTEAMLLSGSELQELSMSVEVSRSDPDGTLLRNVRVTVSSAKGLESVPFLTPVRGTVSGTVDMGETDGLSVKLLACGCINLSTVSDPEEEFLYTLLVLQNMTGKPLDYLIGNLNYDGYEEAEYKEGKLPAGCTAIYEGTITEYELEKYGLHDAGNLTVSIAVNGTEHIFSAEFDASAPVVFPASGRPSGSSSASGDAAAETPGNDKVLLYSSDDLTVEVAFMRDYETGQLSANLITENSGSERRNITLSDILVNGWLCADRSYGDADPGETAMDSFYGADSINYAGIEIIESISCRVTVYDAKREILDETTAAPQFEAIEPRLDPFAYMSAAAGRQTLAENEDLKLELVGLGSYLSGTGKDLTGIIYAENLSEKTMPLLLSGIGINDIYIVLYSPEISLSPGCGVYIPFGIYKSYLSEAQITSINSAAIQILTSEEENSGSVSLQGGRWYPITLNSSGTQSGTETAGEVLYSDGHIEIRLLGTEYHEYSFMDGFRAEWHVAITNFDSESYSLRPAGITANQGGRLSANEIFSLENDIVAADMTTWTCFSYYGESAGSCPELTFSLNVYTEGRGALRYTGAEKIVLPSVSKDSAP